MSNNAERVKRWRNANRALWNLRRKQYRRGRKPELVDQTRSETDEPKRAKVEKLRALMETASAEPCGTRGEAFNLPGRLWAGAHRAAVECAPEA